MSQNNELKICKPVKVWNRPLKADFKDMFKSLTKVLIAGGFGKWDTAAGGGADFLASIGLDTPKEEIAWLLIRRSIHRALYSLIYESRDQLSRPSESQLEIIFTELEVSLDDSKVTIDSAFFNAPADLDLIKKLAIPIKQWLMGLGYRSQTRKGWSIGGQLILCSQYMKNGLITKKSMLSSKQILIHRSYEQMTENTNGVVIMPGWSGA